MDLFDLNNNEYDAKPLADKMRPNNLDEFVGQGHIVAEGSLLRRAIKLDRLGSCIFWGPPGCGKTTLANIIAATTHGNFIKLNAVQSGVADVKKAVEDARTALKLYGKKTYLLLDECHRFNKTQSDSLLPAIEQGTILFIGSTTENPYASMTPAIVSRCRVFEFRRLSDREIEGALEKALTSRKGLYAYKAQVDKEAIAHIAQMSAGDLRAAYNALELAVLTTPPAADGSIHVTLADAEQSIQRKALLQQGRLLRHLVRLLQEPARERLQRRAVLCLPPHRGRVRPDEHSPPPRRACERRRRHGRPERARRGDGGAHGV